MSKYLPELVKIAQDEMLSLQYDIQNASTTFTLQAATQRLFNIVSYLLHDAILDAYSRMPQMSAIPAAPAQAQQAPIPEGAAHVPVMYAGMLPPPPIVTQPTPASMNAAPSIPGVQDIAPSNVASVMITPQGTRVIPASGAGPAVTLPPGSAVDLATMTGRPDLPPAPPGVAQVVLPPGGALPPEVASALAARSAPIPTP